MLTNTESKIIKKVKDEKDESEVVKRDDIMYCKICKVCVELYDHHCDIFDICVCAKTYKFFILLIFYTALTFLQLLFSFYRLLQCFKNEELKKHFELRIDLLFVIFAVVGGLMLVFLGMFLWDMPIRNPLIRKRLDAMFVD